MSTKNTALSVSSTNESANPFCVNLVPGPICTSFEQFRRGGQSLLTAMPTHGVATLKIKQGTFRIIHEHDFQHLIGLASEVHRLQAGLNVVIKATSVAVKHPDKEHFDLLLEAASLIAQTPQLPHREGHESFKLTPAELAEELAAPDDFDLGQVLRPAW